MGLWEGNTTRGCHRHCGVPKAAPPMKKPRNTDGPGERDTKSQGHLMSESPLMKTEALTRVPFPAKEQTSLLKM